jgi:hypothetical protein
MRAQIAVRRRRVTEGVTDLKRALRPVPTYERAVKAVSKMLADAGIRHLLVGALAANAYRRRPRTTEDIAFLVGDEAFEVHAGGFVTMRVPVIEFDGIEVDPVPLTEKLRVIEDGLNRAPTSEVVPIASAEAELTSPMMHTTLSRSTNFCALFTAVAGFTLSSAIRSILRPSTPLPALASSTASTAPL